MEIKNNSVVTPLPDAGWLTVLEKEWQICLPDSYIEILKKYNCSIPIANVFQTKYKDYVLERFLGYVSDYSQPVAAYDIDVVVTEIGDRLTDNENLVGLDVLPVAALFGGDYLCLDFRSKTTDPSVLVWDAHESDELDPVFHEVCSSFDELLDNLKPIDDVL